MNPSRKTKLTTIGTIVREVGTELDMRIVRVHEERATCCWTDPLGVARFREHPLERLEPVRRGAR